MTVFARREAASATLAHCGVVKGVEKDSRRSDTARSHNRAGVLGGSDVNV